MDRDNRRLRVVLALAFAAMLAGTAALDPVRATFSATTANPGNSIGAAAVFPTYPQAVQRDNPSFYYRLDDATADGAVADPLQAARSGVVMATYAYNMAGATGDGDRAVRFSGYGHWDLRGFGTRPTVSTVTSISSPTAFTLELWFATTTAQGGQLAGFGDRRSEPSNNRDRRLYMLDSGQLSFGVSSGGTTRVVTTPAAYNDGEWHHVAAVFGSGGLNLYVDGSLRASDATATTAGSYTGFWRFGGDNLTGWPSAPSRHYFTGLLDEVAVYHTQLTPARVSAHQSAGAGAGYPAAVVADAPYLYWRMSGASNATAAADASGNGRGGHFAEENHTTPTSTSGVSGDGNAAALFDGGTNYITATKAYTNPNPVTVECWFKTTLAGGLLVGLSSETGYRASQTATKDRVLYLNVAGRLTFGVFPDGLFKTVTTPAAYNDGVWHHAVASVGPAGLRLYVDGALRASDASVVTAQNTTGYWRVGSNPLLNWPNVSAYQSFRGSLDEVAVYPGQLSDSAVSGHFDAIAGSYSSTVLADSPSLYWRLDQGSFSSPVADGSGSDDTGTASRPRIIAGVPGPMRGAQTPATAMRVRDVGGMVNPAAVSDPQVLTQEVWIKTTTSAGGMVIGLGSEPFGLSATADRVLYMTNTGRLVFGVRLGGLRFVTTPGSYNDGAWHHVVAVLGPAGAGVGLWVDGVRRVADGSVAGPDPAAGYWRIGGDRLTGWPSRPTNDFFDGDIAEVAVYPTALTAQMIREHYHANH